MLGNTGEWNFCLSLNILHQEDSLTIGFNKNWEKMFSYFGFCRFTDGEYGCVRLYPPQETSRPGGIAQH